MPVHTQLDAVLELTLDNGVDPILDASCQVINAEFTQPSQGEPTLTPVACGGDPVAEVGDPVNGSLSGEVFKDASATGITRLLAKAVATTGTVFDYVYTENEGTPNELKFSGKCTVGAFGIPFTPDKFGRHPIALTIVSADLAAPFAV